MFYPLPVQFSFPPSLLLFSAPSTAVCGADPCCSMWGVLSLAVCMAECFSSSVASSSVSCSMCSAFSKLVPAVPCFAHAAVCTQHSQECGIFKAGQLLWCLLEWAEVECFLPATLCLPEIPNPRHCYLLYIPQYLQALPRNAAASGAGILWWSWLPPSSACWSYQHCKHCI